MATNAFEQKYATNIAGLAKTNNVDLGTASSMLNSNIQGNTNYLGGGVLNMGTAAADYKNYLGTTTPMQAVQQQQQPVNQWTAAEKARLKAIEAQKQGTLDALTRSGVEAQNQYNTGSALLGGQTQTGRRSLAEYLSQRGLTGSGIGAQGEINAIGNLQQGLGGLEATREETLANIQAQRVDAENQALSQQADLAGVQEQRQIDTQATALEQDIAQIKAGAYNQDIQAEINRRTAINPSDPTIPYLQAQRNAKLGGMATSAAEQAQQEFDNNLALEKLAISRYSAYKPTGGSSGGSSGSTSTKKTTAAKTVAPTAAYLALDAQLPNTIDEYKITGIQSAYNKGIISEAEANQLLTKYGLQ